MAQAARRLGRGRRDDRRRHHRQGRRRDPLARRAGGWRRSSPRPATRSRSANRSPRSTPAPSAGEAHPDRGRLAGASRRRAPRRGRDRPLRVHLACGEADRRQARHRSESGRGHRHRRAHAQEGRARPRRERQRCAKAPPVLHSESPYKPDPPRPVARRTATGNREPLTPMRKAIAEHMLASRATVGALHDDRRGRHVAGGGTAHRAEGRRPPASRCRPTWRSSRGRP